jgi:hypothetical protein
MKQIRSVSDNEVTFYCHGKGVTHADNIMVRRWTEQMYHTLLDDEPSIINALERFSIVGSFRKYGIHGGLNTKWHYSGTFFWFRNDDTFKNPLWTDIDQVYYGVEAWPGKIFPIEKSACIFSDDDDSAYLQTTWDKLERKIAVWDEARK